jgi:hypothetical protein
MPAGAAAPFFWGAIASAGGSVAAAAIGSHASGKAADKQVEATTRAAELQKQSNDEALAFQKEEARRAYIAAESDRHANYDQWAAGQRRLSTVGDLLGLGPREIPAYVPMPAYDTGSGSTPAPSSAMPASAMPASASATPPGTVLMQAPDGSTRPIPVDQVAHFQSRGARVVNGASAYPGSLRTYVQPTARTV